MEMQSLDEAVMRTIPGMDLRESEIEELPETTEELALHMQLNYKQGIEIAQEQALNLMLEVNGYELIKKRFFYDLTVLGIGAVKTGFSTSEGIKVEYVDPADLVYSYTDSPYFEDVYYIGEVKSIPINELVKEFPQLSQLEIEEVVKNKSYHRQNNHNKYSIDKEDINKVIRPTHKCHSSAVQ